MSKITIVSRGDQALLIDISGCSTFKEAIEQLSSTLLTANEFWQELTVDLNLGSLNLNKQQAAQIIALVNGVGAKPKKVFARNTETISALEALEISATKGQPVAVSSVALMPKESLPFESIPTSNLLDEEAKDAQVNPPLVDETTETESCYELSDSTHATELETREDIVIVQSESPKVVKLEKSPTLYLKQTLRAGQAVSHKGDLILIGDVNAGAEVMAEGDITIWGSLRGIAHAGIAGNAKAEIRALRLEPIQIRIANYIARSPDGPKSISSGQSPQYTAEVAKLVNGKIRILRNTFEG